MRDWHGDRNASGSPRRIGAPGKVLVAGLLGHPHRQHLPRHPIRFLLISIAHRAHGEPGLNPPSRRRPLCARGIRRPLVVQLRRLGLEGQWRIHHVPGHPIRLSLIPIIGGPDDEFGLNLALYRLFARQILERRQPAFPDIETRFVLVPPGKFAQRLSRDSQFSIGDTPQNPFHRLGPEAGNIFGALPFQFKRQRSRGAQQAPAPVAKLPKLILLRREFAVGDAFPERQRVIDCETGDRAGPGFLYRRLKRPGFPQKLAAAPAQLFSLIQIDPQLSLGDALPQTLDRGKVEVGDVLDAFLNERARHGCRFRLRRAPQLLAFADKRLQLRRRCEQPFFLDEVQDAVDLGGIEAGDRALLVPGEVF